MNYEKVKAFQIVLGVDFMYEEYVYEVLRNGQRFKVFDGRGNALKFIAAASELIPDEDFTLRVRIVNYEKQDP